MSRVQVVEELEFEPLPADYFDLICGTSTGGYIPLRLIAYFRSFPDLL